MLVKDSRGGGRNWAPGVFATFWILLAAFSAAYLFRVISEPMPAGTVQHGPDSSEAAPARASDEPTAALAEASEARNREFAELKISLRDLSQQVEELSARMKPLEKALGPVAMATPSTAITTSAPAPEPVLPAEKPADLVKAPDNKPTNGAKPSDKPADQAKAPDTKPTNGGKPSDKPADQAKASDKKPTNGAKPTEKPVDQAKGPDVKPANEPKAEKPVEKPVAEAPTPEKPADIPDTSPSEEIPPSVTVESAPDEKLDEKAEEKPAEKPAAPVQVTAVEPTPTASGNAPSPATTETPNLSAPIPIPPGTTRFGIEIGSVDKQDALRPLWRDLLTNHAALVAGLQPRRVLAPDKKWRLIAGPFGNVAEAAQACGLFKKASLRCDPTVFAGDQF